MGLPDSEKAMNTFFSSLPASKYKELEEQWQNDMIVYGIDLARGSDMAAEAGEIIDG